MRQRMILAGLVLVVGLAAGAQEEVVLHFWGNENDILSLDLLRDFEALHEGGDGTPRIRVVMGQSATINKTDDPQRLLCAVAGGDPPDVVWFDRFAVGEWAARGAFMSLQGFLERDLRERPDDPYTIHPERFFTPCWEESNYRGELFAVASDTDNRAMFYNRDILDKYASELIAAGCVDPDDPTKVGPPRTWAQLKEASRIMTVFDDGGKLKQVGFIPNYGNSWLYIYGWLNGGKFMSEDGTTCTLNAPEIVEALAYMTEIYDLMGGAEAVAAFQSSLQTGDLDPFVSGKVAMRIDGNPFINNISNTRRNLRFGVAPAPAPQGMPRFGWCGGWAYVIPSGARHPEHAWELIKYLVSQRAYEIRNTAQAQTVRASGGVYAPMMSSQVHITEWGMEHYLYSDPTVEETFKDAMRVFVDIMPQSKYRPVTPVGQLLWNEQVRAMENGIYKRFSQDVMENAQIACDRSAAIVQQELDRILHPQDYPVVSFTPVFVLYGAVILAVALGMAWYFKRRVTARGYFRREFYAGYGFASPWFFGFLVFGGGPLVFSLFISLCEYDVLSPPKFVGLRHYIELFTADPIFYKSLWNTVYMAIGIPLGMAVGLGIALLLNQEIRGMTVYRTLFYLPAIMPAVAASILWLWIFNPNDGILNALLAKVGIDGPAWLQNEYWSKPSLILMGLWGAGASMIVWLAGLKGIPRHLYEAAALDGAGPFRKFLNVTLPMLSPYILFNMVMGFIGTFQIFTQAYIMTRGGPVDSTLFYAFYLFNNGFRYMKMGYASAMAWILFAIILALTLLQFRIARSWVYYESE